LADPENTINKDCKPKGLLNNLNLCEKKKIYTMRICVFFPMTNKNTDKMIPDSEKKLVTINV